MKRKTLTLLALCTISVTALLAVPSTINYQGLISDSEGRPIESITNSISVGLFASESDEGSLYTESFNNVDSDASGVYSIQIGDSNLQALLEGNSELWLELTINGETLTPRQQVHSVPYALHAESANRLVNAETSSISGDLSVSGNTALSGNVNVSNSLSVSGPSTFGQDILVNGRVEGQDARFDFMDVMGPLDVRGRLMTEEINVHGDLEMHGFRADFENAEEVRVPTPDQANEATNKAYVDSADTTLQANIDQNASSMDAAIAASPAQIPVHFAMEWNVSNRSSIYLQYFNPDQNQWVPADVGHRVLLAGQDTPSENGIYTVQSMNGLYASLVRAEDYDSADEISAGDFAFVLIGDLAGQGYVLEAMSESFELGVDALNFSRFTVDTTQDVEFQGRVRAQELLVTSPSGIVELNGYHNVIDGDLFVGGNLNFENAEEVRVPTPNQANEATNKAYVDSAISGDINASSLTTSGDLTVSGNTALSGNVNVSNSLSVSGLSTFDRVDVMGRVEGQDARFDFMDVMGRIMTGELRVHGDLEMHGYRADFENAEEVLVPTPDQANEATNKAYVDNLVSTSIVSDNAKGLVQLAVTENVSDTGAYALTYQGSTGVVNPSVGDLILLAGQTTATENGIYAVASVDLSSSYQSSEGSTPTASDYTVSLTRATNFDSTGEFITGSFVFVEKGSLAGQGYVLGELASDFALGTSPINYVPFTIDTASDVNFEQQVSANSLTSTGDLSVSGNTALSGNVNVSNSLSVSGPSTFGQDIFINGFVEGQDARFDVMDVMGRITTGELRVHGDLEMHGLRADFEYAEEVRVPTPNQANEATNKAYVDSADTTLQANIDAEAVARAEGDSGITSGNTVFTGNPSFTGAKALPSGQTDWASQYYELMPWNMQAFEVPQYATTDVSGLFNADVINAEKMLRVGNMYITENEIRSDFGMVHFRDVRVDGIFEVRGDLLMDGYRANFEYAEEVRVPTPNQANEATNKAYVDSADTTLQANIDAEAVARAEGDSGITSGNTVFTGNPSFTGAKALPSGQTDWASQYYELMPWNMSAFEVPQYATTDVSGLFNADVINAEKMLRVGDMYITENEIRSDFGMVHFRDIFVNGMMRVDGMLEVRGDLFMDGYRANFEYAEEVRVPTPDQANEATNKAYVDSVVVPSGGLIAWPAANPIPSGWSNPGLAAPMANHIWIQKN